MEQLAVLVGFGPRISGSIASKRTRELLERTFRELGWDGSSQRFSAYDPQEEVSYPMVNLWFSLEPAKTRRILLGTHYDTKRYAEGDPDPKRRRDPVPGANNGGSGVAVLMELGKVLSERPPGVGVDIVFFDGEDFGSSKRSDLYFQGSVYFAAHPPPFARSAEAALILDMVGDRDLTIYYEGLSVKFAPALVRDVWDAARRAGAEDVFRSEVGYHVRDDHVALHERLGLDAILLIDFHYDGLIHSTLDTLDKCSAHSLQKVGDTLVTFLYSR